MHALPPYIGLALFGLALWVLDRELHAYHYHDIVREVRAIPWWRLAAAMGLAALSYFVLTGYDFLAFRYVKNDLAYRRIALASFFSYAFSNNVGNTLVTGGSIRYRLYSLWGLTPGEIGRIVAFCSLTFYAGLSVIGGAAFLIEPTALPLVRCLGGATVRMIGAAVLAAYGVYLLTAIVRRRPFRLGQFEIAFPSFRLSLAQAAVASADLATAGLVLFVLLPKTNGLSYPAFLGAYVLSILAGLISQVPGGLGVFESSMVVFLGARMPSSSVFGALLVYRLIYYVAPFAIAVAALGAVELKARRKGVKRIAAAVTNWAPAIVPHVLGAATFIAGAALLFTAATPESHSRLRWLHEFLPLSVPVLEVSHFLASVAGTALLTLALGIQRRVNAAYHLTALLLCGGAVLVALRGAEFEEAAALVLMLAALLASRREFYRKASLFSEPFTAGWLVLIAIVVAATLWLGFFAHKEVAYSNELWWRFSLYGHAPRFLRATVGTAVVLLCFAGGRLLRPVKPKLEPPDAETLERARPIVQRSPNASANLALVGDKSFLFSENGAAFLMYAVEGRGWVAMGDPVGPEDEWADLIWAFRDLADQRGGWPVFYQVAPEHLPLYLDAGLTLHKLGEEARVPLPEFTLEGGAHRDDRYILRRLEREGCAFEIVPADQVPALLPTFRAISDEWLASKNTREKGFSLGFFAEDYLRQFPAAVVRKEDRIVGFANLWVGAGKESLSMDLMRHGSAAPSGVMDFLILKLMLWGKDEGYRWFDLGMAPLAGLENRPHAPLWNRLGDLIYRHGERFYNFRGLSEFKEKFHPEWRPMYLASPGGLALAPILVHLAALIGRGLSGVVRK
ncbi:MAG: bifunctional lysylphosphatidylglycerol flippase/synthetase MprF [Candidatus Sumerlaeota bacterium]|nr:bifunctional lysylphosphatidylglycerol flippase/synthetase MprF [Candidatus Sumerlaeota bacterium]